MLSKKDNRNELSDEDILNGINSVDYSNEIKKTQDTSSDEVRANDFVDSSLFVVDDNGRENFIKDESAVLAAKTDKKQNISPNSLGDIRREEELVVEELAQEEEAIIIQGNKADSKGGFKWVSSILILIIVALAGGVAYVFLFDKKTEKTAVVPEVNDGQSQENNIVPETQTVTQEEGEKEPKIDLTKIKIDVYNGSGVAGAAGKIKDTLVGQKYENIEAKNYPSEKSAVTALYYKEDNLKEEAQRIADFLKNNEVELEIKLASLEEEKSADIVIVLGK